MEVGALSTRISLDSAQFQQGMAGINRQLKALQHEQKAVTSSGTGFARGINELRAKSDVLNRTLRVQQAQVQELARRYEASKRATGENSRETQNAQIAYQRAVADMRRTESALQGVTAEIERQSNPWNTLSRNMSNTGERLKQAGKGMSDFGRAYSTRVTAPIVASGVAMFKAASDYESAFAGVRKTVDATEKEFSQLSSGIRNMAKEIPVAATEIAAIAESAGQLGIQTENIMGFTRVMADLSVATNMTSEQAATDLARLANITQMPQKEFDRLGSSIVALGNNFATTESEIVSMALRLAGQGAQIGLTEAQINALATAMSSVGIEAEAGGTAMSTVLKKMQTAVMDNGKMLGEFAKAAGVSAKDFADQWNKEPIEALDTFIKGLAKSSKEGENLAEILGYLGIKGIREQDTLLRLSGASDVLTNAVKISSDAWKENNALTKEAETRYGTTESQLVILWNRIKDVAITTGNALVPAVMDAIDAAEPFIKQIESGAKKFSELDKEQQRTILKMIGLVAAVGPATFALGQLTIGIGGVMKIGGSLVDLFGRNGGAGLLGKIGMLAPMATSPVGLAIAGAGALALGIYAVSEASKNSTQRIAESIESRQKEIDSTDKLIAQYEKLQKKNQLSTDEVLRYMDIVDELKNTKGEDAIKALTDEQAKLLEKSGLTNKEMEEFLGLNDKIIEKSPSAAKAISKQGNAYADTLDELKKLNDMERQRLTDQTYDAISNELSKQEKNLKRQVDLQKEIAEKEKYRTDVQKEILSNGKRNREIDLELVDLRGKLVNANIEERQEIDNKIKVLENEKSQIKTQNNLHQDTIDRIETQIKKKKKSLEETNRELKAFDGLLEDYAQQVLYEQGIVSEKGKANEALKQQQKEVDTARAKVQELFKNQKISSSEYKEQNKKLDEQQRKIDVAKQKLAQMNKVAGKTVYKDVNVSTKPSIQTINKELASGVRKQVSVFTALDGKYRSLTDPTAKTVNIRTVGGYHAEPGYATGTDYHPGGPFIAGEEGFELGRMGNRWEWLELGRYNKPAGYEVFTHGESRKIIQALNNMPAYASGARPTNEVNRVVSQLNNQPVDNSQTVSLLTRIALAIESGQSIQIGGKEIAKVTAKDTDKFLNGISDRRKAAWGG
jgi:TP901 family phage tail tape measure protein